jgi:hypothetical protein
MLSRFNFLRHACGRCLLRSLVREALPLTQWSLTTAYCSQDDLPGQGQGTLIFTQTKHGLNPGGGLLRYSTLDAGPVHLRTDMLFLRTGAHPKVLMRP